MLLKPLRSARPVRHSKFCSKQQSLLPSPHRGEALQLCRAYKDTACLRIDGLDDLAPTKSNDRLSAKVPESHDSRRSSTRSFIRKVVTNDNHYQKAEGSSKEASLSSPEIPFPEQHDRPINVRDLPEKTRAKYLGSLETDLRDPDEDEFLPAFDRDSTITAAERDTFSRLFDQLAASPRVGFTQSGSKDGISKPREDVDNLTKLLVELETELDVELDVAEEREDDTYLYQDSSETVPQSSTLEPNAAFIERYPRVLRGMAAQAQQDVALKSKKTVQGRKKRPELDPTREAAAVELRAVISHLKSAESDIEIMKVLGNSFFAKIQALNLDKKPTSSSSSVASPLSTSSSAANTLPTPTSTSTSSSPAAAAAGSVKTRPTAPAPLSLPLLTHIAPPALVYATRLLRRCRPTPSPLLSTLLPFIRQQGLFAYVLSASTALYNELLAHAWSRTHSASEVTRLLADMEKAGLRFNGRTLAVVERVLRWKERARDGEYGAAVAAWENGVPAKREEEGQVREWVMRIKAGIEEAVLERVRREEAVRGLEGREGEEEKGDDGAAGVLEMGISAEGEVVRT